MNIRAGICSLTSHSFGRKSQQSISSNPCSFLKTFCSKKDSQQLEQNGDNRAKSREKAGNDKCSLPTLAKRGALCIKKSCRFFPLSFLLMAILVINSLLTGIKRGHISGSKVKNRSSQGFLLISMLPGILDNQTIPCLKRSTA